MTLPFGTLAVTPLLVLRERLISLRVSLMLAALQRPPLLRK